MSQNELEKNIHIGFLNGSFTLYDCFNLLFLPNQPAPNWLVEAYHTAMDNCIRGKQTLEVGFGIEPDNQKQIKNIARKLDFSPIVYHMVNDLMEIKGEEGKRKFPYSEAIIEATKKLKPRFENEYPNMKTPSSSTIKNWYREEKNKRNPKD